MMETFEELNLPAELIEALAAEGAEVPTSFQVQATPVVLRGNSAVLVAGPGSGVLRAWGAPLLARLAEGSGPLRAVVVTPSVAAADRVAEVLGRLAAPLGLRVAGAGPGWALPDHADLRVLDAASAAKRISEGRLSLASAEAVVVDAAASLEAAGAMKDVGDILEAAPEGAQIVIVALPLTNAVSALVERHTRRAVHIPPQPGDGRAVTDSPHRGTVEVLEIDEPRDEAAVREVIRLLDEVNHVVAFVGSEDAAADLGDILAVRGVVSGRAGDMDAPVWLAVDALEVRRTLREADDVSVSALSCTVPTDEDELDRRHGGVNGVVMVLPRERAHLTEMARRAGYDLTLRAPTLPDGAGIGDTAAALERAMESEDVDAYLSLLEPLFARHGTTRVAAAAVALLRKKAPMPVAKASPAAAPPEVAPRPAVSPRRGAGGGGEGDWTLLFVSLGEKDGMRVGDLVGAIAGESGIPGDAIGKIDMRDTFSRVQIRSDQAAAVVQALNGTTIRGRSVRVDLDRAERTPGAARR